MWVYNLFTYVYKCWIPSLQRTYWSIWYKIHLKKKALHIGRWEADGCESAGEERGWILGDLRKPQVTWSWHVRNSSGQQDDYEKNEKEGQSYLPGRDIYQKCCLNKQRTWMYSFKSYSSQNPHKRKYAW